MPGVLVFGHDKKRKSNIRLTAFVGGCRVTSTCSPEALILMSTDETLNPPVSSEALYRYRLGRRLHRDNDLPGGLRELQAALQLAGEHPGILDAIAMIAADGGDIRAAERLLRRSLALQPSLLVAARLAIAVYNQKRYAEAAPLFEAVLPRVGFNPELADAYSFSLERVGRLAESLAVREQIHRRAPTAAHAIQLAACMMRAGRHDLLAKTIPELLTRYPDDPELLVAGSAWALGTGDYRQGFALMSRRHVIVGDAVENARFAACPLWDGNRFDGVLLITTERHLGEEIMMSSLLIDVARLGQPALVEVDARLLPLCRRAWPSLEFVVRGEQDFAERVQAGGNLRRIHPLGLAQLFRREYVLPGLPAWLLPPNDLYRRKQSEYRERWPGKKLVGISWRSARLDHGMAGKSIPLASLSATLSIPDVVFIDLQYGDFRADCDALTGTGLVAPWRDPDIDPTADMDALAAQLCALDEVVLVSNTTAHLAGALGVPTTVLLPKRYPVLWHWGYSGELTTWYESVRLLRSLDENGWAGMDTLLAARLQTTRKL